MVYIIKTHKSVDKFLSFHPEIARQFIERFSIISKNPFVDLFDIRPLKGKSNNYRLRIGKYRFIYEIKNNELLIWIWRADSRGSVYDNI